MKTIHYSSKESSYKLINNVGVFLLVIGIILGGLLCFIGFIDLSGSNDFGITLIGYGIGLFLTMYFCFGVCKGISELVFRAYLRFKLDEQKMLESDIAFQEDKFII